MNYEEDKEPTAMLPEGLQALVELAYEYQGVLMIIPATSYSNVTWRIKHAEAYGEDLDAVYEDLIKQLDSVRGRHTS